MTGPVEVMERIEGKRPTHLTRILAMLRRPYPYSADGWLCSNEFVRAHMPRFSATIHTLRHKKGYAIEGVACTMHEHEGTVFMFRLVPRTGAQLTLDGGR